jgi:hypothetical protein
MDSTLEAKLFNKPSLDYLIRNIAADNVSTKWGYWVLWLTMAERSLRKSFSNCWFAFCRLPVKASKPFLYEIKYFLRFVMKLSLSQLLSERMLIQSQSSR